MTYSKFGQWCAKEEEGRVVLFEEINRNEPVPEPDPYTINDNS